MSDIEVKTINQIDLAKTTKLLESKGIRLTSHRISIAAFVLKDHWHFTADEVFDWAEKSLVKVSRATVYNTLNELVGAGLLRTFQSAHSPSAIFDSNVGLHFHIYDSENKIYSDVDPTLVDIKPGLCEQYDIERVEILITGRKKTQTATP